MKKRASYLLVFLTLAALTACNNNGFKKTKSGLLYKIISDGKGEPVKKGQFIKFNYTQKVHDSLLFSTINMPIPAYTRVDSVGPVYSVVEVFTMLRKGDSVEVVQTGDSLEKKFHQPLPPYIKKKDKLVVTMKVLDVFTADSLLIKDRQKLVDVEKAKEISDIQDYLKKNNFTGVQQTTAGNFYLITTHGNGPKADTGKKVSVRYTGTNMQGEFFDSNIDSTKQIQRHPLTPFEFVIGRGGAVPGMIDAINNNFREGDAGKLFIPGLNGYGQQGAGTVIKPFENLIFDVIIDSVRVAPPPMPRNFNPRMPMNRGQLQAPHR